MFYVGVFAIMCSKDRQTQTRRPREPQLTQITSRGQSRKQP